MYPDEVPSGDSCILDLVGEGIAYTEDEIAGVLNLPEHDVHELLESGLKKLRHFAVAGIFQAFYEEKLFG